MKRIFLALSLALALGGCASLQSDWNKVKAVASAVTGATVSPQAIIILASTYDGLEATAKNYIDPRVNKKCNGSNGPICRDANATVEINKAIRSGRVARNNIKQFLRDHPGQLGTQGLYDALQASVDTLKTIFAKYSIGATP